MRIHTLYAAITTFVLAASFLFVPKVTFAAITAVANQATGLSNCSGNVSISFPNNVTTGNTIVIASADYGYTAGPTLTKSAGTATIGTIVQDIATTTSATGFSTSNAEVRIWHASVTGSGSLTLHYVQSAACVMLAINEYSGVAANPLDKTASTTGVSATESSGSFSPSGDGLIVMVSTEASTANFTYTQSDTNIFRDSNGNTDFTAQAQYKLNSGTGPFTMTAGTGNSWLWIAATASFLPQASNNPASSSTAGRKMRLFQGFKVKILTGGKIRVYPQAF